MRPARIDLRRPDRPRPWPGLAALAVGVLTLVLAMEGLGRLRAQAESLDAKEADVRAREQMRRRIETARGGTQEGERLIARQAFALEPARDLLERGWRPEIALLRVEAVTGTRELRLEFESPSVHAALGYVDWLAGQPGAENVSIRRQAEKPGPNASVVETSLQLVWRSPHEGASEPRGVR